MACSSNANPLVWLGDLARWREECQRSTQRELDHGQVEQGKSFHGDSCDLSLATAVKWPILNPPWDITSRSGFDLVPKAAFLTGPQKVRLSDAAVIFALLTLSRESRIAQFPFDFDENGDVRRDRVPIAPTVVVSQNGIRSLLTWKGTYIFTGESNDAGWLLANEYPVGDGFFKSGLVIAGPHIKTFWPLCTELYEYEPRKYVEDISTANAWQYGNQLNGIVIRACFDPWAHCLVLMKLDQSGYQRMGCLDGFRDSISNFANPKNGNETVQSYPSFKAYCKSKHGFRKLTVIKWAEIMIHMPAVTHVKAEAMQCPQLQQKRKREDFDEELQSEVESRHRSLLSARNKDLVPSEEQLITEQSPPDFKELWTQLVALEDPPEHWDLFSSVIALEDLYRRWGWNEIAAKIVRNKLSPTEANAIRDTLEYLPARLSQLMLGIDLNRDGTAIEQAFSYNAARLEYGSDVNELEDGPIKGAYQRFCAYFDASTAHPDIAPSLQAHSPRDMSDNLHSPAGQLKGEVPQTAHPQGNELHSSQSGISMSKFRGLVDKYEALYQSHQASGALHQDMRDLFQLFERDHPAPSP